MTYLYFLTVFAPTLAIALVIDYYVKNASKPEQVKVGVILCVSVLIQFITLHLSMPTKVFSSMPGLFVPLVSYIMAMATVPALVFLSLGLSLLARGLWKAK